MESGYFKTIDGTSIYYSIDDFTDGWRKPESVLCIHGLAESTDAWRAWVPHLARQFRVVRFDLRGFGRSTPMESGYSWSTDVILKDIDGLVSHLGLKKTNLVGCKSGGTVALAYASYYPQKVEALAVLGSHPYGPEETWLPFIEEHGVRRWLEETMPRRLASLSPEAMQWWIDLMAKTPLSTLQGYLRWFPTVNLTEEIRNIQAPTLVVTGGKIPNRKSSGNHEWAKSIPNSILKELQVDSSHIGGAYPDMCAKLVVDFMKDCTKTTSKKPEAANA